MWPDLGELEPYWETFTAFAISELESPLTFEVEVEDDGHWRFVAQEAPHRARTSKAAASPARRSRLVYDPSEDEINFKDPEVSGGWVMEDVFGGDPYGASSAL